MLISAPPQLDFFTNVVLADLAIVGGVVVECDADTSIQNLSTEEKVLRAMEAIGRLLAEGRPLSCSYSAGKDSSCMAILVMEAAIVAKNKGINLPQILITHARTGIDNPAMDTVAKLEIARIRAYARKHDLPVRVDIVEPSLNDSWAVRIISGRALPTFANSSSRDCAISWKLIPQQRQRKAAFKELKAYGLPVTLVGTRFDESSSRAARMTARGELDTEVWIDEVRAADGKIQRMEHRLSPIAWWTTDDVWVFLSDFTSGRRTSYTDAKDLWDVYRDGGNTSCAVVSDDIMKANSKACGARFGCALCTAVGRDKSLEAMLESDEKYSFMLPLNRIQRFLVDTQYDMHRRGWLGRTIQEDGFIAVAPDSYSPAMQRELLAYALTADRDERIAAAKLGIGPRFELVSLEQLIAIDAIWSLQGYHPRPFEAIHIWESINEKGESAVPPVIDTSRFDKKIPKPVWLYVGQWDTDPGFDPMYNGARSLMADLSGATESTGCMPNIELSDGRVVMATEQSSMFSVDRAGAEDFMDFEVFDSRIHDRKANAGTSEAFRTYQMMGTISTGKRHLGMIDDMLRRAAWKERHGIFNMDVPDLLSRSVGDADRKAGVRSPVGSPTLAQELAARISAQHDEREKGSFENVSRAQRVTSTSHIETTLE